MNVIFKTFALVGVVLSLTGCGRRAPDLSWQEGNFRLYFMDDEASLTKLGYAYHPGMRELVGEEVVAVGSNARWIVAERGTPEGRSFYIMDKKEVIKRDGLDHYVGEAEGPFTQAQYAEESLKRGLPGFTWRHRWPQY